MLNDLLKFIQHGGAKAKFFQSQLRATAVHNAHHYLLAKLSWKGAHAQINWPSIHAHANFAVLRNAALANVHVRHNFNSAGNCGVHAPWWRHALAEHAVNSKAHAHFSIVRFNVNVAGTFFHRGANGKVDQLHHGAHVIAVDAAHHFIDLFFLKREVAVLAVIQHFIDNFLRLLLHGAFAANISKHGLDTFGGTGHKAHAFTTLSLSKFTQVILWISRGNNQSVLLQAQGNNAMFAAHGDGQ